MESKDDLSGGAEIYRKIAKGLKTLNESSLALEVCERALKKYPKTAACIFSKARYKSPCQGRKAGRTF